MALQTSGAISLGDIGTEFSDTAPHSLSEFYGADTGIPSSGEISIGDFYGASAAPPLRHYTLTYFVAQDTQNRRNYGYATVIPNSDGTEILFPTQNYATGYRHYTNYGKVDLDDWMANTAAYSNYGNQATLTGWSLYPNWTNRYSSGGGFGFIMEHLLDESDNDYHFQVGEYLNSTYDYAPYVARFAYSNGTVDWSRAWAGGTQFGHVANMSTTGAVVSDNGTPLVLTQFTESSHPYYNNFILLKFDPSNTNNPLVWSMNPQSVGVRTPGKPCRTPNNRITWASNIIDNSTYHNNIHITQFQGIDWSSSYNNLAMSWGRIVGTGNSIVTDLKFLPSVCSDTSNNIYMTFFDYVTFTGHSQTEPRLNIVKFNSSGVPQEYYALKVNQYYFTSASTKLSGVYHHIAIKGDYLWLTLGVSGVNNITGAGNGYTENGVLLLKLKVNNPSTSTDSNGTYFTPDYQTIIGSDTLIVPGTNKIAGRLNFSNLNDVDQSPNGKLLFSLAMQDSGSVYTLASKTFCIDVDINTNSTSVRLSRDLAFNSTGCQVKVYDLGTSALSTNVSNAVNNGDITSSISNVLHQTNNVQKSTGLYVFREAQGALNPGQSYYWENT